MTERKAITRDLHLVGSRIQMMALDMILSHQGARHLVPGHDPKREVTDERDQGLGRDHAVTDATPDQGPTVEGATRDLVPEAMTDGDHHDMIIQMTAHMVHIVAVIIAAVVDLLFRVEGGTKVIGRIQPPAVAWGCLG